MERPWRVTSNRPASLGKVTYMDKSDKEGYYFLDEIFEGAIAVRDHYTSGVISTAVGLSAKVNEASLAAVAASPKADVGTDTKDLAQENAQTPPPAVEETADSTSFFLLLMSSFMSLIWSVFIRFPLKIISTTLVMAISVVILAVAWSYFEYNSGAAPIGSSFDLMFNRPGIM
jgi:hypothetical protein